jgi:hypothetical protein
MTNSYGEEGRVSAFGVTQGTVYSEPEGGRRVPGENTRARHPLALQDGMRTGVHATFHSGVVARREDGCLLQHEGIADDYCCRAACRVR